VQYEQCFPFSSFILVLHLSLLCALLVKNQSSDSPLSVETGSSESPALCPTSPAPLSNHTHACSAFTISDVRVLLCHPDIVSFASYAAPKVRQHTTVCGDVFPACASSPQPKAMSSSFSVRRFDRCGRRTPANHINMHSRKSLSSCVSSHARHATPLSVVCPRHCATTLA
jgi:hypothetical protein